MQRHDGLYTNQRQNIQSIIIINYYVCAYVVYDTHYALTSMLNKN